MFEEASKRISDYLILGMHHTTKDAQSNITKIVEMVVKEEFARMTPNEFCVAIDRIRIQEEYEI